MNRIRLLLFLISVFVVAGAVSILGLAYYLSLTKQNEKAQITAALINSEDLQAITTGITFTDAGSTNYIYQSPLFDFQIQIDTTKFKFYESSSGLTIADPNYNIQTKILVDETKNSGGFKLSDEVESYKNLISYYDSGKLITNSTINIEGTTAYKFVFTRKSFDGNTVYTDAVLISRGKFLYTIEFSDKTKDSLDGSEIDSVLAGFKFISSNSLDSKATFTSTLWGYSFDYDTRFWKLDASSNSSQFLSERASEAIPEDTIAVSIFNNELSRLELLGQESTFLDKAAKDRVSQISSSTSNYTISRQTDVSVGGRRAKLIDYSKVSTSQYDLPFYSEYLIVHSNALTRITYNYAFAKTSNLSKFTLVTSSFKLLDPTSGQVHGLDTTSAVNNDERTAVLANPAVVQIYNKACGVFKIPAITSLPYTSGKSYTLCSAGTGSGFFVNSDGYVATNGHVAVFAPNQLVLDAVVYGQNPDIVVNLFKDLVLPTLARKDPTQAGLSDTQILNYVGQDKTLSLEFARGLIKNFSTIIAKIKITNQIFVQKGRLAFDFSGIDLVNSSSHYKAKVIDSDYNYDDLLQGKETSSDVALLKLDVKADYPVLSLGDLNDVNLGSSILVIGFPGIATNSVFFNEAGKGQETVTRGIVSYIKQSEGGRKLVQTDASIEHGNSGGPAIDSNSKVIGIATYLLNSQSAGDFNLLRDVADLKALMTKNKIDNKTGKTQTDWSKGLNEFFAAKFSSAITDLEAAKNDNPEQIDVEKLVTISRNKISLGLDQSNISTDVTITNLFNNLSLTERVLVFFALGLLCLVLILLVIILAFIIRANRQARKRESEEVLRKAVEIPVQNAQTINKIPTF